LNENRGSTFPTDDIVDGASGDQFIEDRQAGIVESLAPNESTGDVFAESTAGPIDYTETDDHILKVDPLWGTTGDVANSDATDEAVPKLGLIAVPKYSRYDVSGSLEATRNALDALYAAIAAKADVNERKTLLASFYDAANDLAEHTSYAEPGSELALEEVVNLVNETSGIAVTIGKIAARRLPDSTQHGVFLAGTVSDTVSKGDQYQRLQLTLLGDVPQVFNLLTPATNVVTSGDKVFVLGVRVARPTLEIAGYTADDEQPLIWSEHIVPVK
jgi:hypothetical protein